MSAHLLASPAGREFRAAVRWLLPAAGVAVSVFLSTAVTELLGYWLHRLLHSGRVAFLSRNHMTHHMLLYGPTQPQRQGPAYHDATVGKLALGNIGLEWLLPSALVLAGFLALFRLMGVRPLYQLIFVTFSLTWGFLMFSWLHDQMHIEGFWMEKNPWLKRWFLSARRFHDVHHRTLDDDGVMSRNFGIGFFWFDRLFGTLSVEQRPFNRKGWERAKQRYRLAENDSTGRHSEL